MFKDLVADSNIVGHLHFIISSQISSFLSVPPQKPLAVIFGFLNATRLAIKALRVGKSPNHPRSSESSKQFPSHLTQSHILTKIILLGIRSHLSKK